MKPAEGASGDGFPELEVAADEGLFGFFEGWASHVVPFSESVARHQILYQASCILKKKTDSVMLPEEIFDPERRSTARYSGVGGRGLLGHRRLLRRIKALLVSSTSLIVGRPTMFRPWISLYDRAPSNT